MTDGRPGGGHKPARRYLILRTVLAILAVGLLAVVNDKFLADVDGDDVKWYLFFNAFALVFIAGLTTPGQRSVRWFVRLLAALLPWARSGSGKHKRITQKARDEIEKAAWGKHRSKSLPRGSEDD